MAIQYHRLPGRQRGLVSEVRLFLGPDHLLKVTTVAGAEEYKRFYFSDIQAIVVRRTALFGWPAVVLFTVAGLLLFLGGEVAGFWSGRPEAFSLVWRPELLALIPGLILLAGLMYHLVMGPTCSVTLQTAVHKEPLQSISRLKHFRTMLRRLEPLIAEAQGAPAAAAPQSPEAVLPSAAAVGQHPSEQEPETMSGNQER